MWSYGMLELQTFVLDKTVKSWHLEDGMEGEHATMHGCGY